MKRPSSITLKQIADRLGLSVTTVSRALGPEARRYRIGRETERRVRELAATLGFAPNPLARGLRLKKTDTIGVVIPDVSNPFFAAIVRQIALGARACRYSVIVCDSQDSEDLEVESLGVLRSRGVEGIVLCPVGRSAAHLAGYEKEGPPLVLADRYFPGLRIPYVASDNFTGANEAILHLIDNGHRRIACIQGLRGASPNEDRLRGYREALAAREIPLDEALLAGDSFDEQGGYIATKLLLKTTPGFTAIFAFSNLISLGAIRALSEEGLSIPDDVSMVSFDDQPYAAYLASPMTVVSQSSTEIGQIAFKLLLDRIRSPERALQGGILLPTRLVTRGSVRNLGPSETERSRHRVCG